MNATEAEVDTKLDPVALEAAAHALHSQQEIEYDFERERETFTRQAGEIIRAYLSTLQVQTSEAVELGPDGKEWAKTKAGYDHVETMLPKADGDGPYWYGWALREAFVAGAEWQEKRGQPPASQADLREALTAELDKIAGDIRELDARPPSIQSQSNIRIVNAFNAIRSLSSERREGP